MESAPTNNGMVGNLESAEASGVDKINPDSKSSGMDTEEWISGGVVKEGAIREGSLSGSPSLEGLVAEAERPPCSEGKGKADEEGMASWMVGDSSSEAVDVDNFIKNGKAVGDKKKVSTDINGKADEDEPETEDTNMEDEEEEEEEEGITASQSSPPEKEHKVPSHGGDFDNGTSKTSKKPIKNVTGLNEQSFEDIGNVLKKMQTSDEDTTGASSPVQSSVIYTTAVADQEGATTVSTNSANVEGTLQYMVSTDSVYLTPVEGEDSASFDGTVAGVVGYQDASGQINPANMQIVEGISPEDMQELSDQQDNSTVMYRFITHPGTDQQSLLAGSAGQTIVRFQDEAGNTYAANVMDVDGVEGIMAQEGEGTNVILSSDIQRSSGAFTLSTNEKPISITARMMSTDVQKSKPKASHHVTVKTVTSEQSSDPKNDVIRLKTVTSTPSKTSFSENNIIKIRTKTSEKNKFSDEIKRHGLTTSDAGLLRHNITGESGSSGKEVGRTIIVGGGGSSNEDDKKIKTRIVVGGGSKMDSHSDTEPKHRISVGIKRDIPSEGFKETPHRIFVGSSKKPRKDDKDGEINGTQAITESSLDDEASAPHKIIIGSMSKKDVVIEKPVEKIAAGSGDEATPTHKIVVQSRSKKEDIKPKQKPAVITKTRKDPGKMAPLSGPKMIFTGRKPRKNQEEIIKKESPKREPKSKVEKPAKPPSKKPINPYSKEAFVADEDDFFDDSELDEDFPIDEEELEDEDTDESDEGMMNKMKPSLGRKDAQSPFVKKSFSLADAIFTKEQKLPLSCKNVHRIKKKYLTIVEFFQDEESAVNDELRRMHKEKVEILRKIQREIDRINKKVG